MTGRVKPRSTTRPAAERRAAAGTTGARPRPAESDRAAPGLISDACSGVPHVGVAFVHGIGSQAEGETLLEWSGAIIRVVGDLRVAQGMPYDPVVRTWVDRRASGNRDIEIEVPQPTTDANPKGIAHWVLTEAWWASDIASPSFSSMVDWLGPGGAMRQVAETLLPGNAGDGIEARFRPFLQSDIIDGLDADPEQPEDPGLPPSSADAPSADSTPRSMMEATMRGARAQLRRRTSPASRIALGAALQAMATLVLVAYGALRAIEKLVPVGPLKDHVLTRPIDNFMIDWFGDVFVLLGDPAQAAGVRTRLVSALSSLQQRCERLVVVAHSGGAIVSFMTLSDPATKPLKVTRLITHGEALNLARRLALKDLTGAPREEAKLRYQSLFRPLRDVHPALFWNDFWASQDPAPVGPVRNDDDVDQPRIESLAVWNRVALLDDHGGYWDNDEEFLIPLLRRIDDSGLGGEGSSFFADADMRDQASTQRRRRLAVLSGWRQLAGLTAIAAVITNFATRHQFLDHVGPTLARLAGSIPGHEVVTGPLNLIHGAVGNGSLAEGLAGFGTMLLVGVAGLLAAVPLIEPPERAATWRHRPAGPWIEIGLLLLRLVGVELLAFATLEWFFHIGIADVLSDARVLAPIVVPLLVVLVLAPIASTGFRAVVNAMDRWIVVRRIVVIILMLLGLLAVVAITLAIATRPPVGYGVLAVLLAIFAGRVIQSIGVHRWEAWDRRARVRARRNLTDPGMSRLVILQAALLLSCLLAFFAVIANDAFWLWWAPAGLAIMSVLVGIAIDTSPPDEANPAGPVENFMDAAS